MLGELAQLDRAGGKGQWHVVNSAAFRRLTALDQGEPERRRPHAGPSTSCMSFRGINHVAFVVSDMDRSVRFYEERIGGTT